MTIGSRIKNRRKELGLSVDDIAFELGKNRATIYRYESNDIENLPTSILEPLAKILHTTPAYLMGWDNDSTDYDDLDIYVPSEYNMTPKQYYKFKQAEFEDGMRDSSSSFEDVSNPDIRMIARAGKKMTPEQAENLRKYAQFMFPEAFNDDK